MPFPSGTSLQQSQDVGEVSAAMSALMSCLHTEPESSLHQPLEHWGNWLDAEGFNAASLAAWVCELTDSLEAGFSAEQLQAFYTAGLVHGIATGAFLDALNDDTPGYVEAVQARIDVVLAADEQARQVAGGKGLDVRPAYLASGATLLAFGIACKKGYVTRAYTWTKEAVCDLWTSIRTTTRDVRTAAQDDLMRDRIDPANAIRQAEVVAPEMPTIELDVARLEESTLAQIKGAAATYARKDLDDMFSRTNIANRSWYENSKGLIDHTVKIDKNTYQELRSAGLKDGGFSTSQLSSRFSAMDQKGIHVVYEDQQIASAITKMGPDSPNVLMLKNILQVHLTASYEKVLTEEVKAARSTAAQDVIVAEQTKDDFEASVKEKAYNECRAIRTAAIEELNSDMRIAKEAMYNAGGNFVDVEQKTIIDFEDGVTADL
jgi:hypothetical protein